MDQQHGSRCTRILSYAWKIFTCLFTHVMLVTMVVAYCILGAVTFESLERENEIFVKANITHMRNNVTEDLWTLTRDMDVLEQDNWTRKAVSRIKLFESDLVLAMRKEGWDGTDDLDALQWTFAGALFYSIIVITTIGYGHIAPKTYLGKVTTIFYAIVGIPLMLLCLSNIGDIMAHSFRFLYWRICCYACTRQPRSGSVRSRTRSIRPSSNMRGRQSSRSRTASFKVSGRNSQRSTDSAIGLSDRLSQVQSLSDTESRLYGSGKEDETGQGSFRGMYKPAAYSNDVDLPQRKFLAAQSKMEGPVDEQPDTPVLFNKYAIDPDDHYKGERQELARGDSVVSVSSTAENSKWPKRGQLSVENTLGAAPRGRHFEHPDRRLPENAPLSPSPRIMSPMGFIVARPTPTKSEFYSSVYSDYGEEPLSNQTKPVPIWLCVFLVVSYIVGGAFLFSGWEDWGFPDSAYFCFITLTTIGFGDFVPAQRVNKTNGEMSIALCSLYLLFGIALLAMSFNLVQEEVITNVKAVARHLGIIKDDSVDNGQDYD